MRKKIIIIIIGLIIFVIIGSIGIMRTRDKVTITTLSIREISEKSKEEDICYLTVILGDDVVDEYSLHYNTLKIKAEEKVYNKVIVNSGFAGASIEIPRIENNDEFVIMLKEKNTEKWMIKGVTTQDNIIIQ